MPAYAAKSVAKCDGCGDRFKRSALVAGLCAICENERLMKLRRDEARRKRFGGNVDSAR